MALCPDSKWSDYDFLPYFKSFLLQLVNSKKKADWYTFILKAFFFFSRPEGIINFEFIGFEPLLS